MSPFVWVIVERKIYVPDTFGLAFKKLTDEFGVSGLLFHIRAFLQTIDLGESLKK
jgi:hypothetical protein